MYERLIRFRQRWLWTRREAEALARLSRKQGQDEILGDRQAMLDERLRDLDVAIKVVRSIRLEPAEKPLIRLVAEMDSRLLEQAATQRAVLHGTIHRMVLDAINHIGCA
jgi:hypothetical protein